MGYFKLLFLISILTVLSLPKPSYARDSSSCSSKKAEFRKLYLELQEKLNYEGKDTDLDKNGRLILKAHDDKTPYGGKVFEESLYKEYQNTLRKVAKLYQAEKFKNKDTEASQNKELLNFIQSIDDTKKSDDLKDIKIDDVINGLAKESENKFKDNDLKKFALNENDKYLLKKLLTHAQDRICSIASFDKKNKPTKFFSVEELKRIRNAPLNRLVKSIRDANIQDNSDIKLIDLADEDKAIKEAIKENIIALRKWMAENKNCENSIRNSNFIQANIQSCNYTKLLDTLSNSNENNLESILNFINSNEQFLNHKQAKAETALDENKLENYIAETFKNLSDKIQCEYIGNDFYIRNLPFNKDKSSYNTEEIVCELNDQELDPKICQNNISLEQDKYGNGIHVIQKKSKLKKITFSLRSNPDCKNTKVEPQVEEKVEPQVEEKVEPQVEEKVEPQVEEKVEPKVEDKVEPKCQFDETGRPLSQTEIKECKGEKDSSELTDEVSDVELPNSEAQTFYPDKPVPARFQPAQIPTRQSYMLPGMP